ncbi:tandem-95 repeat protein [Azohydromonas lata]|uniref:Cadherin-like domain-containing protein n=1 Tax=Azohydromonas lata TaxID=45677 RepID=A0ABU5IKT4_9BURK|nr:cadherin-like domain-containing protein [Azohydromonas lata]MDZ5459490.1 cadherin-like domain-containing protein [Azohydromonas lata]
MATYTAAAGGGKYTGTTSADQFNGQGGADSFYAGADVLVYRLAENAGCTDVYSGALGLDTLRLEFAAAQWASAVVQSEVARYAAHLASVVRLSTGEVSSGVGRDFAFDFGGGTRLSVSMVETLQVAVDGRLVEVDAPRITGHTDAAVGEDEGASAQLSAQGTVGFSDVDLLQSHTVSVSVVAGNALGGSVTGVVADAATGDGQGQVAWSYSLDRVAAQRLAAGQTVVERFNVTITDSSGKSATQEVSVSVTGANDAPVLNADGSWLVTPAANYSGALTLSYAVSDGEASTSATLGLALAPVADAPALTGPQPRLIVGNVNVPYTVTKAQLLQGFTDGDGDALSPVNLACDHGTVTQNANGTWTITPHANYAGPIALSYGVSDGTFTTPAKLGLTLAVINPMELSAVAEGRGGFAIAGQSPDDASGLNVRSAGDVNGDGVADLMVSAPGAAVGTRLGAGRTWVIFGSTGGAFQQSAVDQLGTAGADALSDGGTAQTLVAGAGDDTLTATAASVLHGGAGNDRFVIDATMVQALQAPLGSGGNADRLARVDGGGGLDSIALSGAGLALDLTKVAGAAAGDTVNLADSAGTVGWTSAGTSTFSRATYAIWSHNTALATVYVASAVAVI